jgi:hypothetical protein
MIAFGTSHNYFHCRVPRIISLRFFLPECHFTLFDLFFMITPCIRVSFSQTSIFFSSVMFDPHLIYSSCEFFPLVPQLYRGLWSSLLISIESVILCHDLITPTFWQVFVFVFNWVFNLLPCNRTFLFLQPPLYLHFR